ncbi:SRPBCC domain-containing protein [Luedemannella helvata]|uniref:Activator of Hsp90 ATPase homologue 1/2-like C-terminal domain-containing protein n=1 Tax=Luedemannella helvata TaxID=349315 RepID=A0ABN2L744_9ACTN
MAEIILDFFYAHPEERVWRGLTDSAQVARWLMENDVVARPGHRFRLRPVGLPGLDGLLHADVVRVRPGRALEMIWTAPDLHLGVSWRLHPVPGGTVVEVLVTGYLGAGGQARRHQLCRALREAFAGRLPEVLAGRIPG